MGDIPISRNTENIIDGLPYSPPENISSLQGEVTVLLGAMRLGKPQAEAQLYELIFPELKRISRIHLSLEPRGCFDVTELVNEACLRLVGSCADSRDRRHLFSTFAKVMRQILIDHARARRAQKRGEGGTPVPFDETVYAPRGGNIEDRIAVAEAYDQLEARDPRLARVVDFRVFVGLSIDETAELMQCCSRTVRRDWNCAKAWLSKTIAEKKASYGSNPLGTS